MNSLTVFDGAGRGLLEMRLDAELDSRFARIKRFERSVKTLTTGAAPFPANKQAKVIVHDSDREETVRP